MPKKKKYTPEETRFAYPMIRKKLCREKDFKVTLKIGGGKKIAVVEFLSFKTLNEFDEDLQKIADTQGYKLELMVKEKIAA